MPFDVQSRWHDLYIRATNSCKQQLRAEYLQTAKEAERTALVLGSLHKKVTHQGLGSWFDDHLGDELSACCDCLEKVGPCGKLAASELRRLQRYVGYGGQIADDVLDDGYQECVWFDAWYRERIDQLSAEIESYLNTLPVSRTLTITAELPETNSGPAVQQILDRVGAQLFLRGGTSGDIVDDSGRTVGKFSIS